MNITIEAKKSIQLEGWEERGFIEAIYSNNQVIAGVMFEDGYLFVNGDDSIDFLPLLSQTENWEWWEESIPDEEGSFLRPLTQNEIENFIKENTYVKV